MPKVPDNPLAYPKYKYHYREGPRLRIPKDRILKIIMASERVVIGNGHEHVTIDEVKGLCGTYLGQYRKSQKMGECGRCLSIMQSAIDYSLKMSEGVDPSDLD